MGGPASISLFRRFFRFFRPPDKWKLPVMIITGIFTGLILYILYISKAPSYLGDKPETCVNCHIMAPQYATWFHSSHREWTHCNKCHVPQDNVFSKYYFKAKDGLRHATIFTLRKEPQVIFIKEAGKRVVHQNCIYCHSELLMDDRLLTMTGNENLTKTGRECWECHREVPHGTVNSLASVPNARVPVPKSPVPSWLKVPDARDEKKPE
ncbi:MAG: cytochrome c nitrite reductase small subunit [Bacteroidales bacterium]|nr:cytochrome c nitrite reductase small subunit [Bacteroidales bacterium]